MVFANGPGGGPCTIIGDGIDRGGCMGGAGIAGGRGGSAYWGGMEATVGGPMWRGGGAGGPQVGRGACMGGRAIGMGTWIGGCGGRWECRYPCPPGGPMWWLGTDGWGCWCWGCPRIGVFGGISSRIL